MCCGWVDGKEGGVWYTVIYSRLEGMAFSVRFYGQSIIMELIVLCFGISVCGIWRYEGCQPLNLYTLSACVVLGTFGRVGASRTRDDEEQSFQNGRMKQRQRKQV